MMTVKHLTAPELRDRLNLNPSLLLLDVREPVEFDHVHIEGSVLMPLNQLPRRWRELNPGRETVVICHHGVRSRQAAHFLAQAGFADIANLTGGIDAWSCRCDPRLPRY